MKLDVCNIQIKNKINEIDNGFIEYQIVIHYLCISNFEQICVIQCYWCSYFFEETEAFQQQ
jgi:hypothetical protein